MLVSRHKRLLQQPEGRWFRVHRGLQLSGSAFFAAGLLIAVGQLHDADHGAMGAQDGFADTIDKA